MSVQRAHSLTGSRHGFRRSHCYLIFAVIFPIFRAKAKATAAALLKDESFIVKYPALARALKESVEPPDSGDDSDASRRTAVQPAGQQSAESLVQPTPDAQRARPQLGSQQLAVASSSPTADSSAQASSGTGVTAQDPAQGSQVPTKTKSDVSSTGGEGDASALNQTTAEQVLQNAPDHVGQLPSNVAPRESLGQNAPTIASATAELNAPVGEKPLDPPLHYMKR